MTLEGYLHVHVVSGNINKARSRYFVHMTCIAPSPSHPSTADEAWDWSKCVLCNGDIIFHTSRHICCLQLRELWFIDFGMTYTYMYMYVRIHVLIRDEKEERKKQARSTNKQTRQSNIAHPK